MTQAAGGRSFTEVLADVMAADPIYVELEDELPGIIERIRHAPADHVPLVLPERARFGQSRFNFRVLKEYTARLGKRVTIVSADPAIQRMAHENGFAALAAVDEFGAARRAQLQRMGAPQDEAGLGQAPAAAGPYQPVAPMAPAAAAAPLGWSLAADPDPAPPIEPGGTGQWGPPPSPPPGAWSPRGFQARSPAPRPPVEPGRPRPFAPTASRAAYAQPRRAPSGGLARKMRLTVPTYLAPPDVKPGRLVFYGAAALVLLVGVIASIVYMPSAEVDMVAQARPFTGDFSVTGDPGAQQIPIRVATATRSASQTFPAGRKIVAAVAAKGTVTFDAGSCPVGFQIPNGTRTRGPGGVEFATTGGDVNLGGGNPAQAQAAVQATQPGPGGNVEAGPFAFENPNGAGCIQINGGPTTGGADQQQKIEVQKADLDKAQSTMDHDLQQQITAELAKGTRKGEKLLQDQVQWKPTFDADHKAGDDVQNFNANLTENATAYYYRPGDVSRAIANSLNKKVPVGQQIAGNLTTNYHVTVGQNGHLTFSGKATGFVAPRLNIDAVKSLATGRSPSDVRQDLKGRYPVEDVQVKQYPFGLPFMPLSSSRVTVRYQILSGRSA